MHQKLVPYPFLVLANNPKQSLHVRNSFENEISWKLTLLFLSNPVPVNGQNYQKQKGPWTSDQSLFRLQNKFRIIPLVVMYCMTKFDDVIKWFLSYSKNHICKFMQAMTSWHHKLFHFHWSFWIYKMWKGKEKNTKNRIPRERKEIFL